MIIDKNMETKIAFTLPKDFQSSTIVWVTKQTIGCAERWPGRRVRLYDIGGGGGQPLVDLDPFSYTPAKGYMCNSPFILINDKYMAIFSLNIVAVLDKFSHEVLFVLHGHDYTEKKCKCYHSVARCPMLAETPPSHATAQVTAGITNEIVAAAWHPSGTKLALGYTGRRVAVWEIGKEIEIVFDIFEGHVRREILAVQWWDENTIRVLPNYSTVAVLDAQQPCQLWARNEIVDGQFSTKGDYFATHDKTGKICIWDPRTGNQLFDHIDPNILPSSLTLNTELLACIDLKPKKNKKSSVVLFRTNGLEYHSKFEIDKARKIHISPDGKKLSAITNEAVSVWAIVPEVNKIADFCKRFKCEKVDWINDQQFLCTLLEGSVLVDIETKKETNGNEIPSHPPNEMEVVTPPKTLKNYVLEFQTPSKAIYLHDGNTPNLKVWSIKDEEVVDQVFLPGAKYIRRQVRFHGITHDEILFAYPANKGRQMVFGKVGKSKIES